MNFRCIMMALSALVVSGWGTLCAEELKPSTDSSIAEIVSVRRLTLEDCLSLATQLNPNYIRSVESVRQAELSLRSARRGYEPLWAGSVSGTYAGSSEGEETLSGSGTLSVSQKIPGGGTASVSASSQHSRILDDDPGAFSSSLRVDVTRPLLEGAGLLIYRENLTQAERSLIYTKRSLQLSKQEFVAGIASRFWRLLQQRRSVESRKKALESARFARDRNQAWYEAGELKKIEVITAEVNLLKAENSLSDAEQLYQFSLDNFKLDLGLDMSTPVELVDEGLSLDVVEIDLRSCIETALQRRLDLRTEEDRLDDSHRNLLIAENALSSRLDLSASYTLNTDESAAPFADQALSQDYSLGVLWQLPLNKTVQRINYAQRAISYNQAVRALNRFRDSVVLGVRSRVRDLRQAAFTIMIQQKSVEQAERLLELAKIQLEDREITSRDFEDAKNDLLNAEDAYNQALVDHAIAKLELRRAMGTLYIDEERSWDSDPENPSEGNP